MSRDSGTEDNFYEESTMSHHAYVSTSMDNMMEHYADNGSTCLGDMECYNNNDSQAWETSRTTTPISSRRTDQDGASNSSAPRSIIKWTSSKATSTTSRRTWTMTST